MKKQDKISPVDWGVVPVDPEPGFSADANRKVIDKVIKKGEVTRRAKGREFDQQVEERSSATARFIKDIKQGGRTTNFKTYLGKGELARLSGRLIGEEKIRQLKKAYAQEKEKSQTEKVQVFKSR